MTLRKAGKILLYTGAGLVCVVGLLMLAATLALDRAPRYQAEIKAWVHARIGYHIAFARVAPALHWHGPELDFERLELRSKDDRRVLLRAARGRIGADIWHVFSGGRLLAARIELDEPSVDITRLGPQEFAIGSEIRLGGGPSAVSSLAVEDLPAGTLSIRHGRIVLSGWNADLPRLEFDDATLDLLHGAGLVALKLSAKLPPALGGDVTVGASATYPKDGRGLLGSLDWAGVVRSGRLALVGWRQLLPAYLTRLDGGTGSFELTVRGVGLELARADLNCTASALATQLVDEPAVSFDQVSGTFSLIHAGENWTLAGRRVRALRRGQRDPDSQFDASWRESAEGLLAVAARATYLRAETLLPLVGLVPQKDLRERLQAANPSGEWMDTYVDLARGSVAEPWRLALGARFRGVGFAAEGKAPGLRGLSGRIAGTDAGGHVEFDTQAGVLVWPQQFEAPVLLEQLKGTLYWKRSAEGLLVATPALDVRTRDAALHAKLAWQQPADGESPVLTLVAGIDDGNVAQTRAYLPRGLLHPNALSWLDRAFVAGHLAHADVVLAGPVRHFPFRDGSGVFLARTQLSGVTLDYKEGWPPLQNLAGVVEFRNEGMSAQISGGTLSGLAVRRGTARFADFKNAELELHGSASGDASALLGYLRASPLDALAEHSFSAVDAAGPVEAAVDFDLPFKAWESRRTLVHLTLGGVSLNRTGSALAATELTGDADVDGAYVAHADVRGRLLGGGFGMQARAPRNRPVSRTVLVFNGSFSGEALRSALALPPSAVIGGTGDWHGVFRLGGEPKERVLRLNGNLAGLDLGLPQPLTKPVGQALPSSLDVQWLSGEGAAAGVTQVQLTLGSVLRAQADLESGPAGARVTRAAVTFGPKSTERLFSDSQLVNSGGSIERLDLAGWLRLYAPDRNAKPADSILRSAQFEVAELDYLGLAFRAVGIDLSVNESGWQVAVSGPDVDGTLRVPAAADSAEPWVLEFKKLRFATAAPAPGLQPSTGDARAAARADDSPRRIPAVVFHSAETVWDERQFGDVAATLQKLDDGVALKSLVIDGANFQVNARGEWRGRDQGTERVQGTLTSTDVGGTLRQLGYAAVLEAKSGKMEFDLSWAGAPDADNLAAATGQVQVALDKGQITGLKPGAGRVVGLASVAALPRRLALDFSDLTDKGFAFDTARGDLELHDGSAYTDDVLIKGPAAEIGLIGRVGLKAHDYDQTAVVTGNLGSSLPLAAFAGGPVVGAAVLVFTQVFKQPLKGLARGYYRITGSWDNPTVERIKGADAAATAEAPK